MTAAAHNAAAPALAVSLQAFVDLALRVLEMLGAVASAPMRRQAHALRPCYLPALPALRCAGLQTSCHFPFINTSVT